MIPPEVAFERFLREKHARFEEKYAHIVGRVAVEDLPPAHLYRWFVDWMNHQLSDIGVNSTGGVALPPLHFELVGVHNDVAAAHVFEAEEFTFIVMTQPMFEEMLRLSRRLVEQNHAFMSLQIAPSASPHEIAQLLLLMQFSFVTSHEYSHLVRGSLRVSSMRAAPIQVSFPSYPSTTGVPEMDYIFTDRWTCGPGQEVQYTEKPYFLNSGYLVYTPHERLPLVKKLPARRNGYVTFGFFQRPAKLNSSVWDAITKILRKVENSRLLIHHASADLDIGGSASRLRLVAALESRGVDPARTQFRGIVSRSAHMRLLSTVDVALDSFPYTGQTTTCECLWMGVPVVTARGANSCVTSQHRPDNETGT
jgi:hypothetical protein